jgi:hypothetical protein
MNLINLTNLFMIGLLSLSLVACKDTKEKKVETKIDSIQLPCDPEEADLDKISNIMNELVTEQIECITADLKFFIEKFKPDGPDKKGKLSRQKLENVIRTAQDIDENIIDYLEIFYQLNHLILGDDLDYISIESVDKIAILVDHFNRYIVEINPLLDFDKEREVFVIHKKKRKKILETARILIKPFIEEFSKNKNISNHTINIPEFLDVFKTEKNAKTINNIQSLLFVKKILLGGNPYVITQKELRSMINNIPRIGQIVYDLIGFSKIIFRNEKNRWQFYEETLYKIEQLIDKSNKTDEVLITMKNIYDSVDLLAPDLEIDLDFYKPVIEELKIVLTGTDGDFSLQDIYALIGRASRVVQIGKVHQIAYESYRDVINSKEDIKKFKFTNPYFTQPQKQIFNQFVSVAKNYRYFKGNLKSPIYGDSIDRSVKGIIEIGIYEYLADMLMRYFEKKYPCDDLSIFPPRADKKGKPIYRDCLRKKGGKEDFAATLTQYQLELIVQDFIDQLIDLKIVMPERDRAAAESATLMTNLFQFQSDGDKSGYINVQELTEFAIQMVTIIDVRDNITEALKKWCPVDEKGRVEVPCFRRYFFEVLKEPFQDPNDLHGDLKSLADYFPRLMRFYEDSKAKNDYTGIYTFIEQVEKFTRTCAYDDIPMNSTDITSVFAGLFNIESTMSRFDTNKNNIMDPSEVSEAWYLYKNAIEGLVRKEGEFFVKFSKKIFWYLIKYSNIPENKINPGFIARVLLVKPKHSATRTTIAAILRTIKETSENGPATPEYCDQYFRN